MVDFPNKQNDPAAAIPVYPVIGDIPIGPDDPLPTRQAPVTYHAPSGSTTITNGGTSQELFAAGEIVNGAFIVNPQTASEKLFINVTGGTCTLTEAGSVFALAAGQGFSIGPATNAITVNATTTNHAFSAVRY